MSHRIHERDRASKSARRDRKSAHVNGGNRQWAKVGPAIVVAIGAVWGSAHLLHVLNTPGLSDGNALLTSSTRPGTSDASDGESEQFAAAEPLLAESPGLNESSAADAIDTIAALKAEEINLARQLVEKNPNGEEPLILLGQVYRTQGNSAQAIAEWEKALEANPRRADVLDKIALAAFEKDEFERAIDYWKRALELDPKLPNAHSYIGRSLMGMSKFSEAADHFKEQLRLDPESTISNFLLGQIHLQTRLYDQAKGYYQRTIELEPGHTNAYYGLFTVHARLKQLDKAKEYMEIFRRHSEGDLEYVKTKMDSVSDLERLSKRLADLYVKAEEVTGNESSVSQMQWYLKRAVELDPKNMTALVKLADLYRNTGRFREAVATLEKAREINPDDGINYLNLGIVYKQIGRYYESEENLLRSIQLLPDHYACYQELAKLYLRNSRNPSQAKEMATKALQLEKTAENYFVFAWACDVGGDRPEALRAMELALTLAPDNQRYRRVYNQMQYK